MFAQTNRGHLSRSLPRLDPDAVAVFSHALAEGGITCHPRPAALPALALDADRVARACTTLLELRLLREDPAAEGELIPVSPQIAAAQAVGPHEAELARAAAHARSVRDELHSLMPRYTAALRARTHRDAVEPLPDLAAVSAMLSEESARCREEAFTVQPGGGRPEHRLRDAVERDLAMLARGIRLRTLYQHTARSSLSTQGYVETLTAAGAEYRTVSELPDRAVVFDRSVAFLPRRSGDCSGESAVLVRDPDVVAYLCRVFDQHWSGATPFHGPSEAAYKEVGQSLRRTLASLLAEGTKDEVIARRLGVSLRTCRRHIADLLEELGAESRFQGGTLAERAGLTSQGPVDRGPGAGERPAEPGPHGEAP
ncbi:hypothetical protein OG897_29385 [Streptomyces sp. NBC_00237]|uniref:hypothetical protein n=1 Tax=Streptomyces sp. NBC_00237 TaxID=2975687 RepID=UPI002258D4D5|nr:hypothetical protein [Streptomyces sp. NBC_00237]MCX5205561.1 hypothetical protein [Streptomyces sp. NBC_00237]